MKKWYNFGSVVNGMVNIAIFDEIGYWGVSATDFNRELLALGDVSEINVDINSPGGEVFDGIAIYNMLLAHKATVNINVIGYAASIASVVAMAGDNVSIAENAFFMIHNASIFSGGESSDLRKDADLLDQIKQSIITSYQRKVALTDDELSKMMDETTWIDANDALSMGFADSISGKVLDIAACSSSIKKFNYKNIPQLLLTQKEEPKMGKTVKPVEKADNGTVEPQGNVISKDKILKEDQARRDDIAASFSCVVGKIPDDAHAKLLAECQNDHNCTVDMANKRILDEIGKGYTPTAVGGNVSGGQDQRDKFKDGASKAILAKIGMEKRDFGNEFQSYTMLDLARETLRRGGVSMAGLGKMQIVSNAFTHSSSDFPSLLEDVANKSMLKGYEETSETFDKWTRRGQSPDFKSKNLTRMSVFNDLDEIPEGEEFTHGTFSDEKEKYALATYGKMFSITRQAIINDDLDAFSRIPMAMGSAAKRKVGDLVWGILNSNPVMGDGVTLFHASHKNIGTAGPPSVVTLSEAKSLMRKQTDSSGNGVLNIPGKFLLVPVSLEDTSLVLVSAEFDPSTANDTRTPNPHRNRLEVIADARLDDNSATQWFVAADANMFDTIEVGYLDGNDTPFLEQKDGWDIDGVTFKVRIDAAAKALDHRTFVRNSG